MGDENCAVCGKNTGNCWVCPECRQRAAASPTALEELKRYYRGFLDRTTIGGGELGVSIKSILVKISTLRPPAAPATQGTTSTADQVLDIVNRMLQACKPIKFEDFNRCFGERSPGSLAELEEEEPRVGIRPFDYEDPTSGWATSTISLISTITDICVGRRLAFVLDDDTPGVVSAAVWYTEPERQEGEEGDNGE